MKVGLEALADLIPANVRAVLQTQSLRVGRPVLGRAFGHHAAARAGPGLDFRDHRGYAPGDDLRRLDWKAIARRDRLVLRQTDSEDDLTLALLVDGSGGMGYGEGEAQKFAVARALTAALAWIAVSQGDPVAFAVGGTPLPPALTLKPRRHREALDSLGQQLRNHRPDKTIAWAEILTATRLMLPPRSVVIVLSDFLDPVGSGRAEDDLALLGELTHLKKRRHDVVLVQILHRDELEFPWKEQRAFRFVDLLRRRPALEGSALGLREAYLERLHAHLTWWEESSMRHGILLERITSDVALPEALIHLMQRLTGHRRP